MTDESGFAVPPEVLVEALREVPALAHLRAAELAPLSRKGTAHGHVSILPPVAGCRLCLRIPYAFAGDAGAGARLRTQAEAFRRLSMSGATPRLFAAIDPRPGLPGGVLVIDRVEGEIPRLPRDLPLLATTLAAIHTLPLPEQGEAAPLPYHAAPVAALLAVIEGNARFFGALDMAPQVRAALDEELGFARDFAARAGRDPVQPLATCLTDTHPGNFLIDARRHAWFLDMEKVQYANPAVDLAHATLYTSTRWDADIDLALAREDVLTFHRAYFAAIGPQHAQDLRPWLMPLRRMTWLRTMAFMARWTVQTAPGYAGDEPDRWSAEGLSPRMRAHTAALARDYFDPDTVATIRRDWLGPDPLDFPPVE